MGMCPTFFHEPLALSDEDSSLSASPLIANDGDGTIRIVCITVCLLERKKKRIYFPWIARQLGLVEM